MLLWLYNHPADFIVMLALLGAVGVGSAITWYFSPYQRTLRALRAVPRVPIAEATDGALVRIIGTLRSGERTLVAPLSGRTCAHYCATIDEHVRVGKNRRWRERVRDEASCDFLVQDASGTALVRVPHTMSAAVVIDHRTRSGTFDAPDEAQVAFLAKHGMSSAGLLGLEAPLRYHEGVLEPGEVVAVLGRARWEDDPDEGALQPGAGYRETRRKKRLVIEPPDDGKLHASDDPSSLR